MADLSEREKFLNAAIQWLADNPNAHVLVIIQNGPTSIATMTSFPDPIHAMGMIQSAEKLYDEQFRMGVRAGFEDGSVSRHIEKMQGYNKTDDKAKN